MSAPLPSRRLLPVIALAALSIAWAVASPTASAVLPAGDGPDLYDLMTDLKKNLKTVSSSLPDPAADARTLEAVGNMETLLLAAKEHTPANLRDVRRPDRAAHTAAFRADIARALIETLKLEIAVLEGRRDDAIGIARGSLEDMRDAGHEKYDEGDDN